MNESKPLTNDEIKGRIFNMQAKFTANVDPDRLSDYLLQDEIITIAQWRKIKAENATAQERCRALLHDLFTCMHNKAFTVVLQALESENTYMYQLIVKKMTLTEENEMLKKRLWQNQLELEKEKEEKQELLSEQKKWEERKSDLDKELKRELKEKLEQERKVWAEEKDHLLNQMQELQKELSDCRNMIVDIEQERGKERNAWIEEKEQLISQIPEQNRSTGKPRSNLHPVLVQTIRTKAAEVKNKWIRGFTILDKELFVVHGKSSEVEVYDSMKFSFSRRWNLKELIDPKDIGSCNRNKCLYIFDFKGSYGQPKEILRVDPNGKLIRNWSTGDDYGYGLSVTDESSVILTVYNKSKLNEYSSDGQLIREINLSSHKSFRRPLRSYKDIRNPRHAIRLSNGHFVVSHRYYGDDLERVCIVDGDGKLQKSFGGKRGSTIGQMSFPEYLAFDGSGFLMVADAGNSRVLLLDSNLEFMRVILSKEKHGLQYPQRVLLDEKRDRVFVADNDQDSVGRILIFEFR